MKIAYILPVNMKKFGYSKENYLDSHFSINIAREVAKLGHEVSVHTFWDKADTYKEKNLIVHFYPISMKNIFNHDFAEFSFDLLKVKFSKDTIIHYSEPNRLFFPFFIKDKKNLIILQHHGEGIVRPFPLTSKFYVPFLFYSTFFLKHFINKCKIVIVSNDSAAMSFRKYGLSSERIIKYHRGIDIEKYKDFNKLELRKKFNLNQDHIIFLFVGRITKSKGIRELVSAYNEIKKNNCDVDLVLLGPLEDKELLNIVKPYWRGFKNTNELQKWLSLSDIFCLPSYYEAFGIVLIQALYYNLPIIATKVGAIPEFVPENKSILIKPRDVNDLKTAMEKMLDPKFRLTKSSNSRSFVLSKYTWENVAKKYIEIYMTS